MEIWDLYNAKREKLEREWIRGPKLPENCYHLVVHVWVKNNKGEYLISQRAENRLSFPLMWECTGGSVLKNESSIDGAIREVKEEVGIDLDRDNGKLILSKIREEFNDIFDVWLFEYNGEINLEKATTDEVKQVKWLTKEDIRELFNQNKFVNTLEYFLNDERM